ncbi:c-type cytochrome [bacterium]|nr:c-type cytochrome [bacterium]MBU1883393.1 c-type cytochrome [bacterium]
MKKSTSAFMAVLVAVGMMSSLASADIGKGKTAYLKKCKTCHGNGIKGAKMKTQAEWNAAFENNGAQFKAWHKGTKAEDYVNSSSFEKKMQDMRDFLFEYGSDSGKEPSCS